MKTSSTIIPFRTWNVQPDSVAEEDVVAVREGPVVDHQVVRQDKLPRLHQREVGVELCDAVPSSDVNVSDRAGGMNFV